MVRIEKRSSSAPLNDVAQCRRGVAPPPMREFPIGTDSTAIAMLKDLDNILSKTTRIEREHRRSGKP
jgi:hypothetical protein